MSLESPFDFTARQQLVGQKKKPPLSAACGVDIAKLETWIEENLTGQKRLRGVG